MVGGNKCVNCKVNQCDPKDQPATAYPLKEWCGDCIRKLKSTSKGTKCDICHGAISEDAFINLEGTEPKLASHDKDKDWLIHPRCFTTADNEKYKNHQLGKCYEVVIIYGWKKKTPEPDVPLPPPVVKCEQCHNRESKHQITIKKGIKSQGTSKEEKINVCEECKQDRETRLKCKECKKFVDLIVTGDGCDLNLCSDCREEWDKKNKPTEPPKPTDPSKPQQPKPQEPKPNEDFNNEKKWGADFKELKPVQKEGRIATDNSWKKSCQNQQSRTSLLCPYCQEKFDYDKTIEDYLPATKEVEGRLDTHKQNCSLKDDKNKQKNLAQKSWDELREKIKKTGKGRRFFECDGDKRCWGKIMWDTNIADAESARKQCSADKKQHKKECHKPKGERTIAVYHSPNQGGNKHANINAFTYDDMDDEPLKLDNENQEYQQQDPSQIPNNKGKGMSGGMIALIAVGIAVLVGGIIFLLTRNKSKK